MMYTSNYQPLGICVAQIKCYCLKLIFCIPLSSGSHTPQGHANPRVRIAAVHKIELISQYKTVYFFIEQKYLSLYI